MLVAEAGKSLFLGKCRLVKYYNFWPIGTCIMSFCFKVRYSLINLNSGGLLARPPTTCIRQTVTNEQKSLKALLLGIIALLSILWISSNVPARSVVPVVVQGNVHQGFKVRPRPRPRPFPPKQPPQFAPNVWKIMESVLHLIYKYYKSMVKMVVISIFHTYRAFGHDLLAVFS